MLDTILKVVKILSGVVWLLVGVVTLYWSWVLFAQMNEFIKTLPAQLQANMQQQSAQLQTSLQGQIQQQINAVQGKLSTELKGAVQEEGKKIQQQIPSSSLPPTILPH